jgi:hypothetical protein
MIWMLAGGCFPSVPAARARTGPSKPSLGPWLACPSSCDPASKRNAAKHHTAYRTEWKPVELKCIEGN